MESDAAKPSWRPTLFIFGTLLTGIVLFISFRSHPAINIVTGYILAVTFLIVRVYRKYHEVSRPVAVPDIAEPLDKNDGAPFKLSEILLNEFDYVKETASQAMNDRLTMLNYFLLSAGFVVAGIGVMLSKEGGAELPYRNEVLIVLSLIFTTVGWVYFMQIVRLRQAWCESARAMNHIKEFFVRHCEYPAAVAKTAFRWRFDSIPAAEKKMTVFHLSALLISILSSVGIGLAGVILLGLEEISLLSFIIPPGLGFYHFYFQMYMYTALLQEPAPVAQDKTKIPAKTPAMLASEKPVTHPEASS